MNYLSAKNDEKVNRRYYSQARDRSLKALPAMSNPS